MPYFGNQTIDTRKYYLGKYTMLVLLLFILIDWPNIFILLLLFSIFTALIVMCLIIKKVLKIISNGYFPQ